MTRSHSRDECDSPIKWSQKGMDRDSSFDKLAKTFGFTHSLLQGSPGGYNNDSYQDLEEEEKEDLF